MTTKRLCALGLLWAASACGDSSGALVAQTITESLGDEMPAPAEISAVTVAQAERDGFTYRRSLKLALARDAAGLHQVFWMSLHAGFEEPGLLGHGAVLAHLLSKMGDAQFAEALAREAKEVRGAVCRLLVRCAVFPGDTGDAKDRETAFGKAYPATLKTGRD